MARKKLRSEQAVKSANRTAPTAFEIYVPRAPANMDTYSWRPGLCVCHCESARTNATAEKIEKINPTPPSRKLLGVSLPEAAVTNNARPKRTPQAAVIARQTVNARRKPMRISAIITGPQTGTSVNRGRKMRSRYSGLCGFHLGRAYQNDINKL